MPNVALSLVVKNYVSENLLLKNIYEINHAVHMVSVDFKEYKWLLLKITKVFRKCAPVAQKIPAKMQKVKYETCKIFEISAVSKFELACYCR